MNPRYVFEVRFAKEAYTGGPFDSLPKALAEAVDLCDLLDRMPVRVVAEVAP